MSSRRGIAGPATALVVLAGCGGASPAPRPATTPTVTSARVTTARVGSGASARERHHPRRRDSEAATSFVLARRPARGPSAPAPSSVPAAPRVTTPSSRPSPGAPSDAEIRRELEQMHRVLRHQRTRLRASETGGVVAGRGHARAPAGAPLAVRRIIAAGNAIARFPYVYGGGHRSFSDSAYDCSGSVSYALAGAGLLRRPLASGALAHWGDPGPGRWVTIYANAGHAFMYVAGLRFDTSGRSGPFGSRWQTAPRSLAAFAVRHPPGL